MGASAIAVVTTEPEQLVQRARTGDLDAFEDLYRRHVGRVYALCLRMTADPARAEDHAQETFIRVWQQLGSFRGEGGMFTAWLRRVTINVVLSASRSRKRRSDREQHFSDTSSHEPPAGAFVGSTMDLEKAIAKLPDRARQIFVLHDVEGYRHDEVADILGIASGTSKAQLHRARRLLREALTT